MAFSSSLGSALSFSGFSSPFQSKNPPPFCFLSLASYSQRKPCRYTENKVTVIAGVMAMHRGTSVFLVRWTEEDDGFSLKRRRSIVNGHLCFGPWSFEIFVSKPLDKL
jgi:hypothetical protein